MDKNVVREGTLNIVLYRCIGYKTVWWKFNQNTPDISQAPVVVVHLSVVGI